MLKRLNHVAIAVRDLAAASAIYRDRLGTAVSAPQDLPNHGVTIVFVDLPNTRIELMAPLGERSPIGKFLEKHPNGGIHHLCFEVDDIFGARERVLGHGGHVLGDGCPMAGAHGTPVLFLDPKDFMGTLIELEQALP
jgi:methylmalonyl-CoA/ethylmalonyl-CoA epimerase